MTTNVFKGALALFLTLALTVAARGDMPTGNYLETSCQWSDPPSAKAALALLKAGDTIQLYCKTCGDRLSTPVTVSHPEVVATPVAMKQVNINGGMLDQALAYVRIKPNGPWMNLSKLTKCGTPTSNPNMLPAAVLSKDSPGPLPNWWRDVQRSLESLK